MEGVFRGAPEQELRGMIYQRFRLPQRRGRATSCSWCRSAVLHAFQKKSQKTVRRDIELARARYRQAKALDEE